YPEKQHLIKRLMAYLKNTRAPVLAPVYPCHRDRMPHRGGFVLPLCRRKHHTTVGDARKRRATMIRAVMTPARRLFGEFRELILIFALMLVAGTAIGQPFIVPSGSME